MKLNLDKCANLTINRRQSFVRSLDGSLVPRKSFAMYSGAILNDTVDNSKEVLRRIGEATATAKQLQLLWSKAQTPLKWKLHETSSF